MASRPKGEPMATTPSPTSTAPDSPIVAGVRPSTPSAWMTAVSVSGSVPRIVASAWLPSLNETVIVPPSPATSRDVVVGQDQPVGGQDDARAGAGLRPSETSSLTTEGSTAAATCSTLPSAAGASVVLTTGLLVGAAADAEAAGRVVGQRVVRRGTAEAGATADEQGSGHDTRGEAPAAARRGRRGETGVAGPGLHRQGPGDVGVRRAGVVPDGRSRGRRVAGRR